MKSLLIALATLSLVTSAPSAVLAKSARNQAQAASPSREQMAAQIKARGWLGVELGRSTSTAAVTVLKVSPGSPAENAGLQPGDVIVGANGLRYDDATEAELTRLQDGMKPGALVTYMVENGGKAREVKATLATIPDDVLARILGPETAPRG